MLDSLRSAILALPHTTLIHVIAVTIPLLLVLVIGLIILAVLQRASQKGLRDSADIARVGQGIRLLRYALFLVVVIAGVFSYSRSWTGLGVSFGVIAAAGGFALQRPAASVAAWLTILIKRPFRIGDRIAVGTLARGEVRELTATHLILNEVGRYGAEDISGRTIMLPNSIIFDQPVIRYGGPNQRILGEVELTLTGSSDVAAARTLFEGIATEIVGGKTDTHSRVKIVADGIQLEIRYQVPVSKANTIASDINTAILEAVRNRKDISIAHTRMDVRVENGTLS